MPHLPILLPTMSLQLILVWSTAPKIVSLRRSSYRAQFFERRMVALDHLLDFVDRLVLPRDNRGLSDGGPLHRFLHFPKCRSDFHQQMSRSRLPCSSPSRR